MNRFRYALCFGAGLAIVLALNTKTAAAQDLAEQRVEVIERELMADLSAVGIDEISVEGHDGQFALEAGDEDQISIRVHLEARRRGLIATSRAGRAYVESARLETTTRGARLRVRLSGGAGREDTKETWTIVVPRRLAVEVKMAAANIGVTDVAGGVAVKLGTGKAVVDVPRGRIAVKVSVGTATVTTATNSFGNVDLYSQVGDTRFWLGGHRLEYADPPGPGSQFSMKGEGQDAIDVSVDVGDASLRIGS